MSNVIVVKNWAMSIARLVSTEAAASDWADFLVKVVGAGNVDICEFREDDKYCGWSEEEYHLQEQGWKIIDLR